MTDIFPPPGYVSAPSSVEGIEVFKSAAKNTPAMSEVVDFTCPQCGATTAFSATDGALTCTHCGYVDTPPVKTVGKGAEEYEFTTETVIRSGYGWGLERKEVECQNCGARTSIPLESLTHICPFCSSNKVIQRASAEDLLRPRFLVPFKLDAGGCQKIAGQWLGNSWMTPANLKSAATPSNFTGIYLPFWTFDALTSANWKAEVGHTETERYHEGGEWKTRTRTVWRWESGYVERRIDDLLIVGTGRLSKLHLSQVKDYDMGALCPYDPKYLAGFQAQAYDLTLDEAWKEGRSQMREDTRRDCLHQASSSQVRNFSMDLDFADESWRYILLPVYLSAYRFEDQVFQILINGQTGTISGQRPVDWQKVWLVIAVLLAPGLLLGLAGLLSIPLAGVGVWIGGIGFVLLVIGLIIAGIIFFKAQGMDDA